MSDWMQHLIWFLGHPDIYINLVFVISAFAVWVYCLRKTFSESKSHWIYTVLSLVYAVTFIAWFFRIIDRYRFFLTGGA